MTLEQLAYLGEILAALGVVASLIYVARQLGQNTAMMRVAAASEGVERDFDLVAPMLQSRELTEVWLKGGTDFANLAPADQTRVMFFERRAIVLWHHRFQLRQQGILSDAEWHAQGAIIQTLGQRQAVREAWRAFGAHFEPSFRDFVEAQLALADGARDGS